MAEVHDEAVELRDKVWVFAQRGVVALVIFLAGIFVGYQLWGQATKLQEQVEELNEKNHVLVTERDTLRSKVAIVERDKKEVERTLTEAEAKLATAEGKVANAAKVAGDAAGGTQAPTGAANP